MGEKVEVFVTRSGECVQSGFWGNMDDTDTLDMLAVTEDKSRDQGLEYDSLSENSKSSKPPSP